VSSPRLAIAASGADAAEIARLAPLAEEHNIDAIVVGAADDSLPNSDDTYVVTAAAAAAAITRYLRIAVVIGLEGSATPLRSAEDLGVLDVMSNGRLELVLRPGAAPSWSRDRDAVLGAWTSWPLMSTSPDGNVRTMPVTPPPVQPHLPAWVLEPGDPAIARALSPAGALVFVEWPDPALVPGAAALRELRRVRDQAGATTVVIDIGGTPHEQRAAVIRNLGTVVGPCLRCADEEVGILALDATDWLLRRTHLHRPPLGTSSEAAGHAQ
jgi:alkanesulfonate monooxygenase SsuD/methylene tetrahydromethanopterin reductase-like flavin-dependent oxidoreductase (luciferase family)